MFDCFPHVFLPRHIVRPSLSCTMPPWVVVRRRRRRHSDVTVVRGGSLLFSFSAGWMMCLVLFRSFAQGFDSNDVGPSPAVDGRSLLACFALLPCSRANGHIDGWMDGRMDGWMDR